jgi:lysyl-tRNA synthetase class 2
MLEFYTAYFDCENVIEMTENLIGEVAEKVVGKKVSYKGRELSLARPFRRLSMKEAILAAAKETGLELAPADLDDPQRLRAAVEPGGRLKEAIQAERYVSLSHGKRIVQLFEDLAESRLWEPTFITGYPKEVSPLSKSRPDDPETTERFELFAAGMEIANGFSELNDPLEQRARFVDQIKDRDKGDLEAHAMDEDYVRALGHGLPPTGGCGVGIDRLVMILTDSVSIRDVILFPQMRPEGGRVEP